MTNQELSVFLEQSKGNYMSFECKESVADLLEQVLLQQYPQLGIISLDDGCYSRMSVKQYLKFYHDLARSGSLFEEAIQLMQLQDLLHVRISRLSISQTFRVSVAREIIHDPTCFYLKEPFRFLEEQDIRMMMNWLEYTEKFQKKIFMTSNSLKDVCMMPGEHYLIDCQKNIQQIENIANQEEMSQPLKISAKLEDKILLFNPNEIDYIESIDSKTYLNVRNSQFQCGMTMEEIETKLKRFGFYRSHRSYLVNMQKVTEIIKWTRNSYSLKLSGLEDVRIPLSKGRVEEMKELYDF